MDEILHRLQTTVETILLVGIYRGIASFGFSEVVRRADFVRLPNSTRLPRRAQNGAPSRDDPVATGLRQDQRALRDIRRRKTEKGKKKTKQKTPPS